MKLSSNPDGSAWIKCVMHELDDVTLWIRHKSRASDQRNTVRWTDQRNFRLFEVIVRRIEVVDFEREVKDALISGTVQWIRNYVGFTARRISMVLQLDDGTNTVHQLYGVEQRQQVGIVQNDLVEAQNAAVPFDLSVEICDRDANIVESENWWFGYVQLVLCGEAFVVVPVN